MLIADPRGSQRDVVCSGWPIAPSYMSQNARAGGGGAVAGSQPTSTAVHMEPKETMKIYLHIYPIADPVRKTVTIFTNPESGFYQWSMTINLLILFLSYRYSLTRIIERFSAPPCRTFHTRTGIKYGTVQVLTKFLSFGSGFSPSSVRYLQQFKECFSGSAP